MNFSSKILQKFISLNTNKTEINVTRFELQANKAKIEGVSERLLYCYGNQNDMIRLYSLVVI